MGRTTDHATIRPSRTAVPFWRRITQVPSNFSPEGDCSHKKG